MARWQVMFLGKPTGTVLDDGLTARPMDPGFTDAPAADLVALTLGISIGAFATIKLALSFFSYGYNYIGN